MPDIILSSAVRSNLLALQGTAGLMASTQKRLATGLKVNSALDDPTAFFTAASLNDRAGDLNRLLDSAGLAVKTIEAADNAITAITGLVESAQATARQALQTASGVGTATGTVSVSGVSDLGSLTGIDPDVGVQGNVDIGSETDIGANVAGVADNDVFTVQVGSASAVSVTIANGDGVTELLTKLDAIANVDGYTTSDGYLRITTTNDEDLTLANVTNTPLTGLGITTLTDATDKFTVKVGSAAAQTVTIGSSDGITELLTKLNALTDVSASVNTSGYLAIEATNGEDLILANTSDTPLTGLGITATTYDGSVISDRSTLALEYDSLRTQINALASDAGFNGINLLQQDDLSVIFNETGTSSLTISGVDFDSGGLSISAAVGSFQADSSVNAALTELDTAISTLRSQASTFGSNLSVVQTRQDFTKNLINTLETAAAGLTLADTNEEGANLLALQTRQQLSSTALSLASQGDQNVLRLF